MDKSEINTAAQQLYSAQQTRIPIFPLTYTNPDITVAEAYAIQLENIERRLKAGDVISGKKIGLTSPGIQKQLGVSEPDYGHLFASMSYAREIPANTLLQPKIEAEIAFVLKEDLTGGNVTAADVRRATSYIVAAFEIVDSRIADWRIKLPDTVADNASSGCYVLGKEHIPVGELDLGKITMRMIKNGGEPVGGGEGSAVMGDPCVSVAWLANCLYRYGVSLKKDEVILSGAFSAAHIAVKGDVFRADFSVLGSVEAFFI
ncbi:MAG: 2-keto-4-pentenoate hydratase [Oscillospiraceae bacterium]|nr:2-keto-4-pentenoate hydratase [Oscillospiraceae bacterium]